MSDDEPDSDDLGPALRTCLGWVLAFVAMVIAHTVAAALRE